MPGPQARADRSQSALHPPCCGLICIRGTHECFRQPDCAVYSLWQESRARPSPVPRFSRAQLLSKYFNSDVLSISHPYGRSEHPARAASFMHSLLASVAAAVIAAVTPLNQHYLWGPGIGPSASQVQRA